ncbi:GNAT family N-acetyltransferase [Actinotalea sp.]|uniref:GNAT family N-acetyltransferase n=1 Tax=Actinotalea sp. TaxID=1872145 RepID=UPI003569D31E
MKIVELGDAVVSLTLPVDADVPAITRACQDPEVARWTTVPDPYRTEHAEAFVRATVPTGWADGTSATWAIRESGTEHRISGMIGLHEISVGSGEIGYWVAPWARGRGLVGRAAGLVLDHAFAPDGLALDRVSWSAFVGNWPSRRVAWRAGFRVEGTVRGHATARGVRYDAWIGTLLRDDPRVPVEPWPAEAPVDGRAGAPRPLC